MVSFNCPSNTYSPSTRHDFLFIVRFVHFTFFKACGCKIGGGNYFQRLAGYRLRPFISYVISASTVKRAAISSKVIKTDVSIFRSHSVAGPS